MRPRFFGHIRALDTPYPQSRTLYQQKAYSMRASLILVSLASASLLLAPACKDKKKKGKGSSKSTFGLMGGKKKRSKKRRNKRRKKKQTAAFGSAAAGMAASGSNPDRAISQKLGGYIECVNGLAAGVRKSAKRYFSWAGSNPKKPPKKRTRIVYGTYQIQKHHVDRCYKAINAAPAQPATPELTKHGQAFMAETKALLPLVAEAYGYYSKREHKRDKLKKGIAMHGKLTTAFNKALGAANAMHNQVTTINDQLQERRLKRIEEQYGRNLNFLTSLTMMLGKQLVRMASVDKIKNIKGEAFEKAMIRYAAAIKEMTQYIRKNPKEAKRWSNLRMYRSSMQDYVKQILALNDRRTGKRKWSSGDKMLMKRNPGMVDGHPAKVVKSYNAMVNWSNRMRFR